MFAYAYQVYLEQRAAVSFLTNRFAYETLA